MIIFPFFFVIQLTLRNLFNILVQDKEMLHGPSGYGDDDGKFSEYYRAYVFKIDN
jgi:hypothetical protein